MTDGSGGGGGTGWPGRYCGSVRGDAAVAAGWALAWWPAGPGPAGADARAAGAAAGGGALLGGSGSAAPSSPSQARKAPQEAQNSTRPALRSPQSGQIVSLTESSVPIADALPGAKGLRGRSWSY